MWLASIVLFLTAMPEDLVSIPSSNKDFSVCFLVLLLCFYFIGPKRIVCHEILQFVLAVLFYLVYYLFVTNCKGIKIQPWHLYIFLIKTPLRCLIHSGSIYFKIVPNNFYVLFNIFNQFKFYFSTFHTESFVILYFSDTIP